MNPSSSKPSSELALAMVGSNTFGRYPKISSEQTFNMMESDDWLVQTAGWKRILNLLASGKGRGIYNSTRGDFRIIVISNVVYRVSGPSGLFSRQEIFRLNTSFGDVTIDENLGYQIAVCDGLNVWIYDWRSNVAQIATLPINSQTQVSIIPTYVTYHDGYFIVPDNSSNQWYLSELNNGLVWNWGAGASYVAGAFQSKPDNVVAVTRMPGKGNVICVLAQTGVEMWTNVGAQLFPYQRNSSISIDYGCLASTTIAVMDEYLAFLGENDKSGPVIVVSEGGQFTHLSTDGIDFKMADLKSPETAHGFFYKIDGHVFYQLTFYDPRDNFTLIYDFNTKKFLYLTDENMNYHIAAAVCFANNTYYFVSINDGYLYEMNPLFTTYDYRNPTTGEGQEYEIPRVRICNSMRQNDSSRFIAESLTFTVEQGVDNLFKGSQISFLTTEDGYVLTTEHEDTYVGVPLTTEVVVDPYVPCIDMSISKDGGQTFGSAKRKQLNPQGLRRNRVIYWRLGDVNDLVFQFRFWGKGRVVVSNGVFQARVEKGDRLQ